MSSRERTVLIFLTATFLVGAGIAVFRRWDQRQRAARSPIVIENPVDTTATGMGPVDLNRARKYELEALPGIGPVLAGRVIAYREKVGGFTSCQQLRNIAGIGAKRYAALEDLVVVGEYIPPESVRATEPDTGR